MYFSSNKSGGYLLASVAAISLLASGAQAQQAGDHENITLYPISFFEIYNPVTALDMVRQIPGFSINSGGQARGFGGNAGNVLVNGERPSTKSTSLHEILQRIPVERVQKIELVSGSVPGLDMHGQTRVVNVTLVAGDIKSKTSWSFQIAAFPKRIVPTGEVIQSFKWLGVDISLGLQRNAGARRSTTTRNFFDASDTLFEFRNARDQTNFQEWQPHLTLARKFENGDALNVNAKHWNWTWRRNRISEVDAITNSITSFDRFDFAAADNKGNGVEIGGDYEHKIGENRSVKLIFLQRSSTNTNDSLFETFDRNSFASATRVLSSEANSESILRSVFNWQRNPKNSFEASIEGAFNWLKTGLDIEQDTGAGFQPIILPVSNTKVREKRGEAAFSWVTKPASGWTIESGLKYEISEISQSGDASNSRVFKFWKPNLNVTWERNKRDQLRFSVSRRVGQLNFNNFASSIDITDDQTNLGNIELRPDSIWGVSATFERKYGKKGVVSLSASHNWITDVRDRIPINNLFDAPGNIGDGRSWGVSTNIRIPTDNAGIKNGILTVGAGFGNSNVTDPLTGVQRQQSFRSHDHLFIDFRQELTKWKMAWGFDYFTRSASEAAFLFSHQRFTDGIGDLDFFVETTKWKGATIKFSADGILNAAQQRERTNFTGTRDLGIINNTELRHNQSGITYRLSLRGTF